MKKILAMTMIVVALLVQLPNELGYDGLDVGGIVTYAEIDPQPWD